MRTAVYLQVWMLLQKDPICKHFVQGILTPCEKPTVIEKSNGQIIKTMLQDFLQTVIYVLLLLLAF